MSMIFDVYATRDEPISGLQIRRELFHAEHHIPVEHGTLRLKMADDTPTRGGRILVTREEWVEDGDESTTWYGVGELNLRLADSAPVVFEGHEDQFNSNVIYEKGDARELLERFEQQFRTGLDRWKRQIAWVANSSALSPADIRFGADSDGTLGMKIFRVDDDRLWHSYGGSIKFYGSAKLTKVHWDRIQSNLAAGLDPPIWAETYIESQRRLKAGDIRGAILSCAIACETVVRAVFWMHIEGEVPSFIQSEIDKLNVGGLLSRWKELSGLDNAGTKAVNMSRVRELFEARNAAIHLGRLPVDSERVAKLIADVGKFIDHATTLVAQRTTSQGS